MSKFPPVSLILGSALLLAVCGGKRTVATDSDYRARREAMVREQIAAEGVRDAAVLAAMQKVPRHEFVPERQRHEAYRDGPLGIGYGQTISQPFIVAYMSEALIVRKDMKILEIGTGSAYQTAILAELGADVFTIEIVPELCKSSAAVLSRLGYSRVHTRCGNGYLGWPEAAPFDRIILTAAPEKMPQALVDQLKDAGILVAPLGGNEQQLVRIRRNGKALTEERLLPVRFVPMIDR